MLRCTDGWAQEAIHKLTGEDRTECPDFYNILLERPLDDPAGYDVLYLEAAFKVRALRALGPPCVAACPALTRATQPWLRQRLSGQGGGALSAELPPLLAV